MFDSSEFKFCLTYSPMILPLSLKLLITIILNWSIPSPNLYALIITFIDKFFNWNERWNVKIYHNMLTIFSQIYCQKFECLHCGYKFWRYENFAIIICLAKVDEWDKSFKNLLLLSRGYDFNLLRQYGLHTFFCPLI